MICHRSEVAQSCPTLCDPMDCSLPGSSVHGIFQARIRLLCYLVKLPEDMVLQTLVVGRPACDLSRGVQGAKLPDHCCFTSEALADVLRFTLLGS